MKTRKILTFITLILLFSCSKVEKKVYVEELVLFGTSGFCIIDSTNWIFDSTRLDIREYLEYKKDSTLKIARRRPNKPTEYFSSLGKVTLGLDSLINKVLLMNRFKNEYTFKEPELYDGWGYTLYYKTSNQKEYFIQYIPKLLPDSLRVLHNFIQNIIVSDDSRILDKFEYNRITFQVAKDLYRKYPPPPPTKPLFKVKFTAPTKNESNKK
jgi:hypothetical protein